MPSQQDLEKLLEQTEIESKPIRDLDPVVCQFTTGAAGTGKSFEARRRAREDPGYKLCAMTGIAAVNLDSITVHSVLKFFDTESLRDNLLKGMLSRRIQELGRDEGIHTICIDEVSMMSGEQGRLLYEGFQQANKYLDKPIALHLTGDFAQLPPITKGKGIPTDWLFDSPVWPEFEKNLIKLTEPKRQVNPEFLQALNLARSGNGPAAAKQLQACGVKFTSRADKNFPGTTVFPLNETVDSYNNERLRSVPGEAFVISAIQRGTPAPDWKNIPRDVTLKPGALVMILINDWESWDYANGDLAEVLGVGPNGTSVKLRIHRNDAQVTIGRHRKFHIGKESDPGAVWVDGPIPNHPDGAWVIGTMDYLPVRLGYATTVHKCLHPDTWIKTRKGICRIADIMNLHGDEVWTGEDWAWVKARMSTLRPLVTIHTQSGRRLRCSPEHPILRASGEFTQAGMLSPGNELTLRDPVGWMSKEKFNSQAWLWGALLGDGWLCHPAGEVHFSKTHPVIQAKVAEIVAKAGVHVGVRKDGRGLHWASKKFRDCIPLGYEKASQKKLPACRLMDDEIQSLLAGLFDTDGSVYRSGMVFTTKSQDLARGVLTLLLSQGIKATLSEYSSDKSGVYWQVRVGSVGLMEFKRLIPLQHPEKAQKLAETCPNRIIQSWETDVITKVELAQEIPMVDLELESEPHQFWADGFITHNSQGLTLDNVQISVSDWFFGKPHMAYVALSRSRTPEGLTIIGSPDVLGKKINLDPKVLPWI